MIKKVILFITLMLVSFNVYSKEELKKIALFDIDLSTVKDESIRENIRGFIFEILYLDNNFNVLEIEEVDKVVNENSDISIEMLGEDLNVDLILTGQVRKLTTTYLIKFKLYSVESKDFITEYEYTYKTRKESENNDNEEDDDDKNNENINIDEESEAININSFYSAIEYSIDKLTSIYKRNKFKESQKRQGSSIDTTLGFYNNSIKNEDDELIGNETYGLLRVGYTYQFTDYISAGVNVGYFICVGESIILEDTVNPLFGIEIIIGRKVDSFAFSAGFAFTSNIIQDIDYGNVEMFNLGLYYKNFMVKASPFVGDYVSVEIGYSYYFGK